MVYKGNGLYAVDFALTGQLTHDFAFPTIEKMQQILETRDVVARLDAILGWMRAASPAKAS